MSVTEDNECDEKPQINNYSKLISKKVLIILLLFSIGIIIGISLSQSKNKISRINNKPNIQSPTPSPSSFSKNANYQISQNKYSDSEWSDYSDYYLSFTLKHPQNWIVNSGSREQKVIISQECRQAKNDCASLEIKLDALNSYDNINSLIEYDPDLQNRIPEATFITKIGGEKTLGYIWDNYNNSCEKTMNGVCLPLSSTYKAIHSGQLYTINYENKLSESHHTIRTSQSRKNYETARKILRTFAFIKKNISISKQNNNMTYTNEDVGFSFEYPSYISFADTHLQNTSRLDLYIEKNENGVSLQKDNSLFSIYATGADIPRVIHGIQAKENIHLFTPGDYEGNTNFVRYVLFEYNGYKIIIRLIGDSESIKKSMPDYFKEDPYEKGILIWSDMQGFYQQLKSHIGLGAAQAWYDDFDKIINSIELK